MKSFSFISILLLFTLGLFSCDKEEPTTPGRVDDILLTYRLTRDTSYSMSNTGGWSPGTGHAIDSIIKVTLSDGNVIINHVEYTYITDMDVYVNSRNTIKLWGDNKEHISITYVSGVGYQMYKKYTGQRD